MRFEYCPKCRAKLIPKEIGDEGIIPYCDTCKIPRWDMFSSCIICAVINEFNEIALIKQEYVSTTSYVCVAGIMQPGENAEQTAMREIKEEIGLEVKELTYIRSYFYEKKDMLMLGYHAKVKKASFKLSSEVDAVGWFPLSDALAKLREGGIAWQLVKEIQQTSGKSIPILDFDDEDTAIIMPLHGKKYYFPENAVLLFMAQEIEDYATVHNCEVIGEFESITKIFKVYKTTINNKEVCFCQAPLGGAGAVQVMDQIIAAGAKHIIAAGCCGALVKDTEGEFYIPRVAIRQEGTSYHYLPPAYEVELNQRAIKAIELELKEEGYLYKECKTWTTDGFYRETKGLIARRKSEGCSVVEMECASLAACASRRKVIFGQLLFTADSLSNEEGHNTRNWGKDTFAVAMELALKAVTRI